MSYTDELVTGMQVLGRIPDLLRRASSSSLSEYVSEARVEPPVLIDIRARHLSYLSDIMHTANSLYSGYYLQAWAMSVNVGRIDVRGILDGLNDRRNPLTSAGSGIGRILSSESYKFGLPDVKSNIVSTESQDTPERYAQGFGRDTAKIASEAGALSVGRLLEVAVEDSGAKAVIPVSVRLNVSFLPSDVIENIISHGSMDTSAKSRYHGLRSGRIMFWRDVILQQDVIDQHRKTLMRDTSGYYRDLMKKRGVNALSTILSGNPSVGTAATITVITKATKKAIETKIGASLDDYKTRQQMFKKTYTTLLFVIDTEYEAVDIYHRGIQRPTELMAKDLKSINSKTGPDVAEILKMYQLGRTISI